MKVLIVDGPWAGEVQNPPAVRFRVPTMRNGKLISVDYHVHQFMVSGQTLRLASTHSVASDISLLSVAGVILSDKAKEVIDGFYSNAGVLWPLNRNVLDAELR